MRTLPTNQTNIEEDLFLHMQCSFWGLYDLQAVNHENKYYCTMIAVIEVTVKKFPENFDNCEDCRTF